MYFSVKVDGNFVIRSYILVIFDDEVGYFELVIKVSNIYGIYFWFFIFNIRYFRDWYLYFIVGNRLWLDIDSFRFWNLL